MRVTVTCWSEALEFRMEGDPRPYIAEAEGAFFRNIEVALGGRRVTELVPGALEKTKLRIHVPSRFRGAPNPNPRGGFAGFYLIEPKHSQITKFAFEGLQPPSALMQEIVRAFDPRGPQLAATAADKEQHHAQGQREATDHPDAAGRPEAEGTGEQHTPRESRGPRLQGRQRGRHALEGDVEPDLSSAKPKHPRRKKTRAEKERLRKVTLENTQRSHEARKRKARAALSAFQQKSQPAALSPRT